MQFVLHIGIWTHHFYFPGNTAVVLRVAPLGNLLMMPVLKWDLVVHTNPGLLTSGLCTSKLETTKTRVELLTVPSQ